MNTVYDKLCNKRRFKITFFICFLFYIHHTTTYVKQR